MVLDNSTLFFEKQNSKKKTLGKLGVELNCFKLMKVFI